MYYSSILFYCTFDCILIIKATHLKQENGTICESAVTSSPKYRYNSGYAGYEFGGDVYWNDATVDCGLAQSAINRNITQNSNSTGTYNNFKTIRQFLRIVNGKSAELGNIPWIVALFHNSTGFKCGGVIVSRRHFLTAAHCLENDSNWLNYYILAGSLNYYSGKKYRITQCDLHWRYNKNVLIKDDIALCRLHINIEINPNVSPICLPQRRMTGRYLIGKSLHISGYGDTNTPDWDVLKESQVTVISNRQCQSKYRHIPDIRVYSPWMLRQRVICAGTGGRDTCHGDSGGPLAYFYNGRWYLVGISVYGWKCGSPKYPGVYTSVAPYRLWIKRKIKYANIFNRLKFIGKFLLDLVII